MKITMTLLVSMISTAVFAADYSCRFGKSFASESLGVIEQGVPRVWRVLPSEHLEIRAASYIGEIQLFFMDVSSGQRIVVSSAMAPYGTSYIRTQFNNYELRCDLKK